MAEAARHIENGPGAEARLRVVLVGRTGLDAMLRRDGGLELVRVANAVEAVGEAVNPPDPGAAPLACIIVAAHADPGGAMSGQFVAAARAASPSVRLVLAADQPGAGAGAYDAVVSAAMPFHALKAVLLSQPEPQPAVHASPAAPAASAAAPALPADDDGQGALLQAVLAGRDVVLTALEQARRRSGVADLVFTPGESAEGCPVAYKGRAFGRLTSAALAARGDLSPLAPHAALMARWLALAEQQKELRRAALIDDLTGAYNRRYFDRFLRAALEQAARDRHPLLLMLFDIDNLKKFNDAHGHAAGDQILRETVRLMTSVIRPADRVCRIGGDEFAVVFYEPSGPRDPASKPPSDAAVIARRFQEQVCAQRFPKLGLEAPGTLTISGGLACYPWDGRTAEELIARADELAMQSKRAGKNAITLGPGVARQ